MVLDAISNGSTPAGLKAREMCAETARRKAEEQRMMEAEEAEKKLSGGLSMEAVQAHTAGQGKFDSILNAVLYLRRGFLARKQSILSLSTESS